MAQEKSVLIDQTGLAFEFLSKLYFEVSYLIKEMEGLLNQEEEKFLIGKPSGYGISTRSSTGLEPANVGLWLLKKMAVFFVPEVMTKIEKGMTRTDVTPELKVLYLRIILDGRSTKQPVVYLGPLFGIENKGRAKWISKFEHMMNHIEYNDQKVLGNPRKVNYEDAYLTIRGELLKVNLFDITDSEAVTTRLIKPSLQLYREH